MELHALYQSKRLTGRLVQRSRIVKRYSSQPEPEVCTAQGSSHSDASPSAVAYGVALWRGQAFVAYRSTCPPRNRTYVITPFLDLLSTPA